MNVTRQSPATDSPGTALLGAAGTSESQTAPRSTAFGSAMALALQTVTPPSTIDPAVGSVRPNAGGLADPAGVRADATGVVPDLLPSDRSTDPLPLPLPLPTPTPIAAPAAAPVATPPAILRAVGSVDPNAGDLAESTAVRGDSTAIDPDLLHPGSSVDPRAVPAPTAPAPATGAASPTYSSGGPSTSTSPPPPPTATTTSDPPVVSLATSAGTPGRDGSAALGPLEATSATAAATASTAATASATAAVTPSPTLPAAPTAAPPAPPAAPAAASGTAPSPPTAPPLTAQLAGPVFSLAASGAGEHVMTVTVSPDDLGPVTVRAQVSADGIRVELFAPTDAGRDALRGILSDLRRDLGATGSGASLDLSPHDAPSGERDGTRSRDAHLRADGMRDAAHGAEQTIPTPLIQLAMTSTTIDVLV